MLDINKIRNNKAEVEKALLKRMRRADLDLDKILKRDEERRKIIAKAEALQAERNKASKSKPTPEVIKQMKKVGEEIAKIEKEGDKIQADLTELLAALPNTPADDVVAGGAENNQVLRAYGRKPEFKFKIKDHVELATSLGLIDYERAVKMSGSGYWAYLGDGALLEWALLNYFIDFHRRNNYIFMIPPYLLNEQSAFVSGHLPKFKADLFWTEERGMIRGHQFNKIEMFQLTRAEDSWQAFEEMLKSAEELLKGLELHYS